MEILISLKPSIEIDWCAWMCAVDGWRSNRFRFFAERKQRGDSRKENDNEEEDGVVVAMMMRRKRKRSTTTTTIYLINERVNLRRKLRTYWEHTGDISANRQSGTDTLKQYWQLTRSLLFLQQNVSIQWLILFLGVFQGNGLTSESALIPRN